MAAARPPTLSLMPPRRPLPDTNRKALTPDEERALFTAAKELGARPYVFIRWATETASRVSEACATKLEAIDWANGSVTIARSKGSNRVVVPLSERLLKAVKALVGRRREGWLFGGLAPLSRQTAYTWMDRAGALAKIHPGLRHPHVLRHTGISDKSRSLQDAGMPLPNVLAELAAFSGHRRTDTLMIYLVPPEHKAERVAAQRKWYDEMP